MFVYRFAIYDDKCIDPLQPRYVYFESETKAMEYAERIKRNYRKEWVSNGSELLIREAYNKIREEL